MMLDPTHSVLNKDSRSIGAQTAVMSKTVIGEEPVQELEVPDTIDEVAMVVEEQATEEVSVDASLEAADDAGSGEGEGQGEEAAPTERYFTFLTSTTRTVLNCRKDPSEDSKVLWKLAPKTFGYILVPGNEWCKVVTDKGWEGYCATEYLDMTEVTKADFPEEYADLVEISEESLDY